MATFTLEPIGGTSADHCKVYDNGNQQCHLMVSFDFVSLIGRPLYPDEIESIKLATYDASTFYDNLTLPTGMTSTQTQNQFDPHPDNTRGADASPEATGQVFTKNLYVSCNSQVVGSQRLMAAVRVHDDENPGQYIVYTTHMQLGDGTSFESSVTVTPEPAWIVSASELTEIDRSAKKEARNTTYGWPYIWELPSPLDIRQRAMKLDGSWNTSVEEHLFYRDRKDGGINEVHECSSTTKTDGYYHFSDGRSIEFHYTNNQFGAGWIYIKDASLSSSLSTFDEQQEIRMLDNYGTYQTYTLDGDGSGITIR